MHCHGQGEGQIVTRVMDILTVSVKSAQGHRVMIRFR